MTGERTLPGAGLTGYWNLGDSTWKPGMDANLRAVSALLQLSVNTRTTALPGSPAQGDMHLVPAGAGSHPNEIALYDSGAWVYITPRLGTRAFVDEDDAFYFWDGTAWTAESSGGSGSAGTYRGAWSASPSPAYVTGDTVLHDAYVWYCLVGGTTDTPETGSDWAAFERLPTSYDIPLFIPDKPSNGMLAARIVIVRACALPAGFTGSQASAGTASTGTATFGVFKGATSIGSVTFTASATGTFTSASGASFAAGDVLRIVSPATADATLSDISITFAGTRTG